MAGLYLQSAVGRGGVASGLDHRLLDRLLASVGRGLFCDRLARLCWFCRRLGLVVLGGESIHPAIRLRDAVRHGPDAFDPTAGGLRHTRNLVATLAARTMGIPVAATGNARV